MVVVHRAGLATDMRRNYADVACQQMSVETDNYAFIDDGFVNTDQTVLHLTVSCVTE